MMLPATAIPTRLSITIVDVSMVPAMAGRTGVKSGRARHHPNPSNQNSRWMQVRYPAGDRLTIRTDRVPFLAMPMSMPGLGVPFYFRSLSHFRFSVGVVSGSSAGGLPSAVTMPRMSRFRWGQTRPESASEVGTAGARITLRYCPMARSWWGIRPTSGISFVEISLSEHTHRGKSQRFWVGRGAGGRGPLFEYLGHASEAGRSSWIYNPRIPT
jgi:hypothetical protein